MPDFLKQLHQTLHSWVNDAATKGWLTPNAADLLDSNTVATPGSLFNQQNRPLVVGLFGGTGVGKSTLLNRFAAEHIANASVERPTSREITLYVHTSVSVDHLPAEFPIQQLRMQTHSNEQYRSVMWIDMPDFDSVEQANRDLVTQWLPHIDVVIYVVSPERYRDDQGWRLLLEHGARHAWVFVINHWDRGDERQRDDFRQLLHEAGLKEPLVFCTDCREIANKPSDEFESLQSTLVSMADEQLIAELESRGVVQRLEQIRHTTGKFRKQFGASNCFAQLQENWTPHWHTTSGELTDSVQWKIGSVAERFAEPNQGLVAALMVRIRGKKTPEAQQSLTANTELNTIIDDSYFDRVNETVDEFAQLSTHQGLSISALRNPLNALKPGWRQKAGDIVNNAIHESLAAPGTPLQRHVHRLLGWLCWLLPLAAASWIGYRIINGFRLGASDPAAYLGTNFAVHSGLLFAMSWLLPVILFIKLKPSRQKAAERGINQGLINLNQQIDEDVQQTLTRLSTDKEARLQDLDAILSTNIHFDDATLPSSLQRMLLSDLAVPEMADRPRPMH